MELNSLIEEITREIMRRLGEEKEVDLFVPKPCSPSILIPILYGPLSWSNISKKIDNLISEDRYTLNFAADVRDKSVLDRKWQRDELYFYNINDYDIYSEELFKHINLVVVPVMPVYSLSRIACLTPANLTERIVLDSIQKGINVIIGTDEFYHDSPVRKGSEFSLAPGTFNKKIKKYEEEVSSYGIKFVTQEDLLKEINVKLKQEEPVEIITGSNRKEVITNEDVKLFASSGNKVIKVSPGAIITPLARDTARELGIEIK